MLLVLELHAFNCFTPNRWAWSLPVTGQRWRSHHSICKFPKTSCYMQTSRLLSFTDLELLPIDSKQHGKQWQLAGGPWRRGLSGTMVNPALPGQPQCWLVAAVDSFVTSCCSWMNRPIWIIVPFPTMHNWYTWASLAKFKWRRLLPVCLTTKFQSKVDEIRLVDKSLLERLGVAIYP